MPLIPRPALAPPSPPSPPRRDRKSRWVALAVLSAAVGFASGFAAALTTYLHEHAHAFGADGTRRFTDALTEVIEGVVTHRRHADALEARWEEARARVLGERLSEGGQAHFGVAPAGAIGPEWRDEVGQ